MRSVKVTVTDVLRRPCQVLTIKKHNSYICTAPYTKIQQRLTCDRIQQLCPGRT